MGWRHVVPKFMLLSTQTSHKSFIFEDTSHEAKVRECGQILRRKADLKSKTEESRRCVFN